MEINARMWQCMLAANIITLGVLGAWGWYGQTENNRLKHTIVQLEQSHLRDQSNPDAGSASQQEANTLSFPIKDKAKQVSSSNKVTHINTYKKTQTAKLMDTIQLDQAQTAVSQKYAMLMNSLRLNPQEQEQLQALLVEREQALNMSTSGYFTDDLDIMAAVALHQELLDAIDSRVGELLSAEDFERFELFKDSGLEQYQLTRFENTLVDVEKLQAPQAQELLMSKLKYKREFLDAINSAQLLAQSGDKKSARFHMELAVRNYQHGYLADAEQILSAEQFEKLAEFETYEFEDIYLSLLAGTE